MCIRWKAAVMLLNYNFIKRLTLLATAHPEWILAEENWGYNRQSSCIIGPTAAICLFCSPNWRVGVEWIRQVLKFIYDKYYFANNQVFLKLEAYSIKFGVTFSWCGKKAQRALLLKFLLCFAIFEELSIILSLELTVTGLLHQTTSGYTIIIRGKIF